MAKVWNVLTVAGVDPSGGAGVLADVKAISAQQAYACAVVTALTAQNTQAVRAVHPVPASFVRAQIDTLLADVAIAAVKIGMLGMREVVQAVAEGLGGEPAPHLVLDPVMVAKSGDALLPADAVGALIEALLPLATVLTPNLPEAGVLLGQIAPQTLAQMRRAAEALRKRMSHRGQRWVLLKGGHLPQGECAGQVVDILYDGDRMIELASPRVQTKNTHGTGCTLSAALAACLPQCEDVPAAVGRARDYLSATLARADELAVGQGHGPVFHFPAWPA